MEYHLRHCLSKLGNAVEVVVEVVLPVDNNGSPILSAFLRLDDVMESVGYLRWGDDDKVMPVTSEKEQKRLSSLVVDIQAKLLLVLPSYAVPTTYIPVRHFPLSLSGKSDRKRLRTMAAELSMTQLARFSTMVNSSSIPTENPPISLKEQQL